MSKPNEICVIVALGQKYDIWNTVEVTRSAADPAIDHCMLTVSEISTGAKNFAAIKLQPGDPAQVFLAGFKVMDGMVYLRQAAYDAGQHAVQIGISSRAQSVVASTVDTNPGQYINQTLQQIASAVFGKVGVGFSIDGSPPGADKPFPRVSEHVGETRFAFIERLCRMRNVHVIDNGGTILAFRGPSSGGLTLTEGKDILRARLSLSNNDHADNVTANAQNHSQDSADANRASSATITVTPPINRPVKIVCEETGDDADCLMRAEHEGDWIRFQFVDGEINTPGWLIPGRDLWWNHVRETIVVNSPMLVPNNSFGFMIKGVVHRQSSEEGTTTDVLLCRIDGLGTGQDSVAKNPNP
jgi:prophage tail gpP-like protein